ncbi:MAG: hypothetical protein MI919_41800, partial [Holophagales bacterium]|nr:hypothetical protein [Holophagales bacterium]
RRHAREELHHGDLFRDRASALRQEHGVAASDDMVLDKPFDLTRGRESAELDAHGFFRASLFEEMGIIPYVAMLHVAEQKAAALFRVHRDLTRDDPETCKIFEEILRDEKYHVAYTGTFLKQWRKEGKTKEVREALAEARGSRLLEAWKRAGVRAGGHFSRVVLTLFYWTAMVPFAFLVRLVKQEPGWQDPAGHHHHGHSHGHHHHGHSHGPPRDKPAADRDTPEAAPEATPKAAPEAAAATADDPRSQY